MACQQSSNDDKPVGGQHGLDSPNSWLSRVDFPAEPAQDHCTVQGGPFDGAVLTQQTIWEFDKGAGSMARRTTCGLIVGALRSSSVVRTASGAGGSGREVAVRRVEVRGRRRIASSGGMVGQGFPTLRVRLPLSSRDLDALNGGGRARCADLLAERHRCWRSTLNTRPAWSRGHPTRLFGD